MFRIYNTLTRKIEDFKPHKGNMVGLYTCGPTVYNYAHIGNLRTYIFEDLMRRVLELDGYDVCHVMNITDVGHLTSDADEGEDKLEKGAVREGKSVWDVARFFTKAFFVDLERLNIEKPGIIALATEYVKEQIALIEKLFSNGYAYETSQAVYFDVTKFSDYTKLSGQKLSEKITGARDEVVEDSEKRYPADFVLWFKLIGKFERHSMYWPSPWGRGFPGWHIECSAISTKFLGQPFDIHAGGVDHIGVHHTNEIAQSEAAYGKPLASFWVHGEHLLISGEKMSKSSDDFLTLDRLVTKGFDPLDFRYLMLTAHYRTQQSFSWESLQAARNARLNLLDRSASYQNFGNLNIEYQARFEDFVNDDLNLPEALAVVWEMVKSSILPDMKAATLVRMDRILGLRLFEQAEVKIPDEVGKLKDDREKARAVKDFVKADKLREDINRMGWLVIDTSDGARLIKKIR
jgi:cysteinyl-tRNA synthetase